MLYLGIRSLKFERLVMRPALIILIVAVSIGIIFAVVRQAYLDYVMIQNADYMFEYLHEIMESQRSNLHNNK